jgi:hypothetical protein
VADQVLDKTRELDLEGATTAMWPRIASLATQDVSAPPACILPDELRYPDVQYAPNGLEHLRQVPRTTGSRLGFQRRPSRVAPYSALRVRRW